MTANLLPFRPAAERPGCDAHAGASALSFSARRLALEEPSLASIARQRPVLLLVDREPGALLAACGHLEKAGFEVCRASTAAEAAVLFASLRPDIAVIDAALPDGDGFALCERLRATSEGRETPLVLSTEDDAYETIRRTHDAGASDFAVRPVNWLVLSRRLSNMLDAERARRRLRVSLAMRRETEQAAHLASWSCGFGTDAIAWSRDAAEVFGFSEASHGSPETFLQAVHPDDRHFVESEIRSAARERRPFAVEHRIHRPSDGAVRYVRHCADFALGEKGEAQWIRGIVQDVTDQVVAEEQIWRLSNLDALTGLPNRAMLPTILSCALSRAERVGRHVAVLFLDIDRFEEINERYGAAEGDQLIVQVAARLDRCVRETDPVTHPSQIERAESLARLSGDEFVVVLTDVEDPDDIARVAQRILDQVSSSYRVGSAEVFLGVSVGISMSPQDGLEAGALIQHAQTALFQVKRQRRGSYRFYSETLNAEVTARLDLETGLHRALERNELSVYYQPIVDGASRRVTGFEALLRWTSAELGPVSPTRFIPVAEESGLIIGIGEWVLRTACRQAASWEFAGLGPLQVSVNVSTLQLARPGFAAIVRDTLDETCLAPGQLSLEITESALLAHDAVTIACLAELKEIGVRLVIDDFGTGYSALQYLKKFRADGLKIDRSFVEGLARDPGDTAIVSALVAMSHGLRITVVAEGVETEEQFLQLQSLGCDEAQGFLFSCAVPAGEFRAMLAPAEAASA